MGRKEHRFDSKGRDEWSHVLRGYGSDWVSILGSVFPSGPVVGETTIVKSISIRFDGRAAFLVVRGRQLRGDVVQMRQVTAPEKILHVLCAILRTPKWKPDKYGSYLTSADIEAFFGKPRNTRLSDKNNPLKDVTNDT